MWLHTRGRLPVIFFFESVVKQGFLLSGLLFLFVIDGL